MDIKELKAQAYDLLAQMELHPKTISRKQIRKSLRQCRKMLNKLHNKIPIQVLNELGDVMKQFNITNSFRLTHFLAQVAHESGNFKHVRENLNYSTEGLLKVFPKYFDKKYRTSLRS